MTETIGKLISSNTLLSVYCISYAFMFGEGGMGWELVCGQTRQNF